MNYISPNEEQTKSIGRQLAAMVSGGDIITLSGDLGAGKTTFTKGFAEGLGVTETITSPTFSLMNMYPVSGRPNTTQCVHIDTYRLETEEALLEIGVEDYLADPHTITLIEWPEKIPTILKKYSPISVSIQTQSDNTRRISIQGIS